MLAQIRPATLDDLPQIIELCRLHAIFEESDYQSEGKAAALAKHLFQTPPALYCQVATIDQQLLGYVTYMKQFSTWDATYYLYLDCLFLKSEARGQRIGERLMDAVKEAAKELNCSLIQWQTPDFNQRAMKFYRRIGASSKSKERFFLLVD